MSFESWAKSKGIKDVDQFKKWAQSQPQTVSQVQTNKPIIEIPKTNTKRYGGYAQSTVEEKWRSSYLKPLPSSYGKSYNDKLKNWVKEYGGSDVDAEGFQDWVNKNVGGQMLQDRRKKERAEKGETDGSTWDEVAKYNRERMEKALATPKKSAIKPTTSKPTEKKKEDSFFSDIKDIGKATIQGFNPFDNVSMEEAVQKLLKSNKSKTFEEVARGSNRAVDSASFGAMSNLDKKLNNRTPYYNSEREFGEGGGTDMLTTGLGYLTPGLGAYKWLNAMKLGTGLTKFGSKGIAQRLISEGAKGAAISAGMSGAEVGIREGLNPEDQNWKENLSYVGKNTALGAVADPLLYGTGKVISGGLKKASNKTIQNMLPSDQQNANALSAILEDANRLKPTEYTLPNGTTTRLKGRVQSKLNATSEQLNELQPKVAEYDQEFQQAVQDQYEYLKNSMGKGTDYGTTGDGLGNYREANGSFNVSRNPQWYQDLSRQIGYRRPTNEELMQLAEKHVREGFQDEVGSIPAWQPKRIQEIDDDIDEIVKIINEQPEQTEVLMPILEGLEQDKQSILKSLDEARTQSQSLQQEQALLQQQLNNGVNPSQQNVINKQVANQSEPVMNQSEQIAKPSEQGANGSQQPLERSENLPYAEGERKHYSTLANSEKATDEFVDGIKNLDRSYQKISDNEVVDFANGLIGRDLEEAFQFVKNADRFDKRHTAVGARLIDVFQSNKDFERAVDLADILAKEGTKAGQGLQGFSVYNRLSVEGHLIRAQRRVTKLNQTLPEGQKVTLTPEIAEDIAVAADSIQKLTGQEEIGKSVIDLLEKAKKGTKLTDEELKSVRSFMENAKKFVGDLDASVKPQKAKPIKDVRTRDKVVDFMGKQEEAARKRLKQKMNRANSLPVDMFYDLTVIGASKIAKGTVKFADFTESMLKEFGEEIRPYMQQLYNKSVETFNLQSSKMTSKRLTQAEKLVNKAIDEKMLSPEMADELLKLSKKLLDSTGNAKIEASMELQTALVKLEQPTFDNMLSSTHYQAMLLNPLTTMRNIIGNEVFYRVERASKLLAIPIDAARSKITGSQRTIVFNTGQFHWGDFLNPTKAYLKGMKIGAKAGWKGINPLGINTAYDIKSPAFSSEISKFWNPKKILTAPTTNNLSVPKRILTSKYNPLHWTEKLLGVTMRSFDTAGYMRAYNSKLREEATLKAMNEGLKGRALREASEKYFREADENLIAIADQYGKYATFQDNTALARALTRVKEGTNKLSTKALSFGLTESKDFGAGNFIMPFPKTPANLVMRALEYSPAGFIRSVSMIKNYFKGGKNPLDLQEAQIAFARAIIGTGGFSGLGYVLADRGVLTSSGNSDYEVRELEKMAGKQPNSVNTRAVTRFIVGGFNLDDLELKEGDTFVSFDWAQPVALAIALGTGVNQTNKESEDPTLSETLIGAGDSAANTIVNMSSLSGINQLVSGPPGETWSEKIASSMSGSGGSFVPTFANQIRKVDDNTARNTYDPTRLDIFKNKVTNRIPGKEKELPPSYNTFGEKKELYPNKSNNLFNVFFNPSYVSQYNPSEEAKVLLEFINATGNKNVAPRLAPKTINVEGEDGKLSETVALTGEEQSEYQRIMGEETKKGVQRNLNKIQIANPFQSEEIMDDILREASKKAKEAIRNGRR